jgi:hypothetical protein
MRNLIAALFVLLCIIASILGFMYGPKIQEVIKAKETPAKTPEEQAADMKKVQALLQEGKPDQAMEILRSYQPFITQQNEAGKQWLGLLIETATQQENIPQLLTVYEYFPSSLENNEKATQIVAKGLLAQSRGKDYDALRNKWKSKEKLPFGWFLLDADKMILDGQRDQAIAFLNTQTLEGKYETDRLIRLALLTAVTNPAKGWEYLSQAMKKDPENPNIRLYRARMLEAVNKPDLALAEYFAAVQLNPTNLFVRDQLANFFQRYHQYGDALQVWEASLKPPSEDVFWIRALFWSRVFKPITFDWKSTPIPTGSLKPYVEYLISLPKDTYWNEAAFNKIPNAKNILGLEQDTLWLRVIQALKDGNETQAAELLQFDPFKNSSWYPALSHALQQVLSYRKTGSFNFESKNTDNAQQSTNINRNPNELKNVFFTKLNDLAANPKEPVPEDYKNLLTGTEAFSIIFLAAGWNEAALELQKLTILPDNFPEWIALNFTNAYNLNRTPQDAIDFATKQKQTPELSLLIGQLLITSGNVEAGLNKLKPLADGNDPISRRAAWLTALVYIDKKDPQKAREYITAHKVLADDVSGKELLARASILEGNIPQAETIYSSIEGSSLEAKSFLARQAFDQKNFKRAQELTEAMLLQYPNNIFIRINLEKIYEAEQKSKDTSDKSNK